MATAVVGDLLRAESALLELALEANIILDSSRVGAFDRLCSSSKD